MNMDTGIMTDDAITQDTLSALSKIGYGILLPLVVFIAYQFVLIGTQSGTGSWDGMIIFFGTLFLVPGLLILNCWIIPLRWHNRRTPFMAGITSVPTLNK